MCYRADLGQILQSYNINFALLDTVLSNDRQFSKFLMYLVQQETPLDDIIKDALSVFILPQLNSRFRQLTFMKSSVKHHHVK